MHDVAHRHGEAVEVDRASSALVLAPLAAGQPAALDEVAGADTHLGLAQLGVVLQVYHGQLVVVLGGRIAGQYPRGDLVQAVGDEQFCYLGSFVFHFYSPPMGMAENTILEYNTFHIERQIENMSAGGTQMLLVWRYYR